MNDARKRPDKDPETGHFLPGNKLGNRFAPGESGNPSGRPPNGGRTVLEHYNDLAAKGVTLTQLQALVDNGMTPVPLVTAAQRWLDGAKPDGGGEFERMLNHTNGRAVQRMEIAEEPSRDPAEVLRQVRERHGLMPIADTDEDADRA